MSGQVHEWAGTLPPFAADVVSQSDTSRPHVYSRLVAEPHQLSVIRSQITTWAQQVGIPAAQEQDIVLATDEAVSNAIEHAYSGTPGPLTLFAALARKAMAVRIIVADHGKWRPPPADRGFRGRGLAMMERLAQLVRVLRNPQGTTVVLGWSLACNETR